MLRNWPVLCNRPVCDDNIRSHQSGINTNRSVRGDRINQNLDPIFVDKQVYPRAASLGIELNSVGVHVHSDGRNGASNKSVPTPRRSCDGGGGKSWGGAVRWVYVSMTIFWLVQFPRRLQTTPKTRNPQVQLVQEAG